MSPSVFLCAGAVAGLLVAQGRGSRPGVWVTKTCASTAFVWAALAFGALESGYGRVVLVALALCWLGDVLLIPRERPRVFLAGIAAFLLGHVAYAVAFLGRAPDAIALGAAAALAVPAGLGLWGWLRPHLAGPFRFAVLVYVVVILAMVATAAGRSFGPGPAMAVVGAVMFAASDVSVARDRFVAPGFANALWGLPLYYAAQLLLASTVRL